MKKLLLASTALALSAGIATAQEVKMGVLLGYTGPIEDITPYMADSAELAMSEISDSGMFLGGATITPVRADSTCVDSSAAQAAAERLISSDGIVAMVGADCSGVTMAVLQNVAMSAGVPMISPSATSPAFTTTESNGMFFRTAPSDARQGVILADIVMERGFDTVALTHTNNDYGSGFATAFAEAYTAAGGTITTTVPHEEAKGDYSAEVGTLAAAGGDALIILGYTDGGGSVLRTAYELGAFDQFFMGDGMYGDALIANTGEALEGTVGTIPWAQGDGADAFTAVAEAAGVRADSSYTRESYDAAAILALAAQAAGEATPAGIAANVLNVANAPGEPILPGELAKGLEILANGGEIDYVGATNVELVGPGEAAGSFREYIVDGGEYTTVKFH
ncbi:Leucine-, isoleucine-, valine-, threonine-, and alanine-binding protein [Roseibaca ekhonensis]|uniref:Leucine-, isoleucine-, valine-, threonine-, and alanine-binding protein n=1 Tax=Roseinatronobacter ekhonensis TaxID=254356 RepID=A0A3B0MWN1_9RHOB|nr:ABC transporter substrate-binding protein [Roseibaca ekhonensis]SUZ33124.1 Leucine-, isoleucine-, valine-, threonine-, and alanine-binding protein [Roseibaca ekhonensis]